MTVSEQRRLHVLKQRNGADASNGVVKESEIPYARGSRTEEERAFQNNQHYQRFFEHIPSNRFPRVNDVGFVEQALGVLNKE